MMEFDPEDDKVVANWFYDHKPLLDPLYTTSRPTTPTLPAYYFDPIIYPIAAFWSERKGDRWLTAT